MKRTTVKIPDELDAKLRFEAKRSGKTISEVTREALEVRLGVHRRIIYGAGMGDSGRPDMAERADEILAEEWPRDLMKEFTREP